MILDMHLPLPSEMDSIKIQRKRLDLPQASSLDLGLCHPSPLGLFPYVPTYSWGLVSAVPSTLQLLPVAAASDPGAVEPPYSVLCPPLPSHSFPPSNPSSSSAGPSPGVIGLSKAARLLAPLEAGLLLLRKVRGRGWGSQSP